MKTTLWLLFAALSTLAHASAGDTNAPVDAPAPADQAAVEPAAVEPAPAETSVENSDAPATAEQPAVTEAPAADVSVTDATAEEKEESKPKKKKGKGKKKKAKRGKKHLDHKAKLHHLTPEAVKSLNEQNNLVLQQQCSTGQAVEAKPALEATPDALEMPGAQ